MYTALESKLVLYASSSPYHLVIIHKAWTCSNMNLMPNKTIWNKVDSQHSRKGGKFVYISLNDKENSSVSTVLCCNLEIMPQPLKAVSTGKAL